MRCISLVLVLTTLLTGPAVAAHDATPTASTTMPAIEPLVAAYLPAHRLDRPVDAVAYVIRLSPGGWVEFPAGSRPNSATLETVVAGVYAVRSESPLVVLRGKPAQTGGMAEEAPAGQEVTVAQGEAVINVDSDAPVSVRNVGDGETLVFGAGVVSREDTASPATPTWGMGATDATVDVVGAEQLREVEGPVSVLLARWTLGPGQALPSPAGPWPELAWAEAPFDMSSRRNPGPEPITVLVASFGSAD